jgi:NAD(P)-dependent dehydrogenase (short-subunit alcohol dehydrogenase family)
MSKNLDGKTVMVTGGGKGIGREIARLFGSKGCNVVISGRDQQALDQTAVEFSQEQIAVLHLVGDVTSVEDCRQVVEETLAHFGRLDILINNAGMTMRGLFERTDLKVFHKIMDINFGGAATMTWFALPHIKKQEGSVLFISSIAGLKGLPGAAPYCASKMALRSFSESLRCELMGQVHIGILYVGFAENDPNKMMYNARGELVQLKRDKYSASQLDVARAVLMAVHRRRRQVVMTPLGKIAGFLYTFFPAVSEYLIARFAVNSSMYAADDLFK